MRNRSLSLIVVLVTVSIVTYRPVLAQGPATVEPMHVHHVHLNSLNPKAAAEYYLKPFSGVDNQDDLQWLRGGQDGQRLFAFPRRSTHRLRRS